VEPMSNKFHLIKMESSKHHKKFRTPGSGGGSGSGSGGGTTLHLVTPFGEMYPSTHNKSSSSSPSSSSSFRVARPTAAAQRTLRLIHYFVKPAQNQSLRHRHQQQQSSLSYNADILASTLPYCIGFHQIYIHVVQLVHLTKDEVIPVINGSIVGLCQATVTSNQGGSTSEGTSDTPHILPGETPILPCHGLGIVRSVDVIQKLIYLITPIRLTTLKRINLLIRGKDQSLNSL